MIKPFYARQSSSDVAMTPELRANLLWFVDVLDNWRPRLIDLKVDLKPNVLSEAHLFSKYEDFRKMLGVSGNVAWLLPI